MLNISTHLSVSWPQPAGQGVAPVTAVTAVQPVQPGGRNSPSGPDAGRPSPPTGQDEKGPNTGIRGRSEPTSQRRGDVLSERSVDGQRDAATERAAEQAAEQAAAQADARKAADEARHQQLQEVLSNVWKASAAVVDRVLGRDAASAATPQAGPAGEASSARAPMVPAPVAGLAAVEPLPWPLMPEASPADDPAAAAFDRSGQEVVAYDEHGNSSWAPLEAGALISRRV